MASQIITVRLAIQDVPKSTNLKDQSWLLTAVSKFPDSIILAMLVASAKKSPSLGRLFNDLQPKEDGTFTLEVGAILPDWVPNLESQQDYFMDVPLSDGDLLQLCLSNQMWRVRYKTKDEHVHVLVPSFRFEQIKTDPELAMPEYCHVDILRTMASARFQIIGTDAEEALEGYIDPCVNKFVSAINRVIGAHVMMDDGREGILNPVLDRGSFDYLYIMLQGNDPLKIGAHRLGLNIFRATLNPPNYPTEKASQFVAFVNGANEVDDIRRLIAAGKSYVDGGVLVFALLQLVVAAEVATARFIHKNLLAAGVSKSKLKEFEKDMTYSRMLNLDLFAVCPPAMKPDRDMLGILNRARDLRNDVMHKGEFKTTADEIHRIYDATVAHIEFLKKVLGQKGLK